MPEMTDEQRRVNRARQALHRDGASPGGALDLLAAIVSERTWEGLTDSRGRAFAGRFRDFVREELQYDPDQLPKLLELRHPKESVPEIAYRMAETRQAIKALLISEIQPIGPHGGDHTSEQRDEQPYRVKLRPNRTEHIIARLKRSDPDLAARVARGELSATAAARLKGWRKPEITVSSPGAVARALRKYMSPDQISELARLLEGED